MVREIVNSPVMLGLVFRLWLPMRSGELRIRHSPYRPEHLGGISRYNLTFGRTWRPDMWWRRSVCFKMLPFENSLFHGLMQACEHFPS